MSAAYVSDVQHFSVGDGPGIRTTVFLKGCNLRCAWCHNPETVGRAPVRLPAGAGAERAEKVFGREMSAEELLCEIEEDAAYYARSGGGVTWSGGEPLLQSEFLAAFMPRVRFSQIVDTAGDVDYSAFERVLAHTDEFYFDLKCASAEKYARHTGGNFARISGNLRRLIADGASVTARVPVIPRFNAEEKEMNAIAALAAAAGVKRAALLPFHRLGAGKYAAMGLKYAYADTPGLPPEGAEPLADIFRAHGLETEIEK